MIGITLGDPGGIGPEIVFKTFASQPISFNYVLFGAKSILSHPLIRQYAKKLPLTIIRDYNEINQRPDNLLFFDCGELPIPFCIGSPNAINGKASYTFIMTALQAVNQQLITGIVTAPICKESFQMAGIPYKDHTSLLKIETQSRRVSMAFYTPRLKTVLATIHIPYRDVPDALTADAILTAYENSRLFSTYLGLLSPKIAIAGLNPHAGENGLFGDEEQRYLLPVIEQLATEGKPLLGPIPADTLYHRAAQGEFDIVISLYHDQALIPIKLLGFFDAVNITLGLPFLRTSPDHGTAFELAYQDRASLDSFKAALRFLEKYQKK